MMDWIEAARLAFARNYHEHNQIVGKASPAPMPTRASEPSHHPARWPTNSDEFENSTCVYGD